MLEFNSNMELFDNDDLPDDLADWPFKDAEGHPHADPAELALYIYDPEADFALLVDDDDEDPDEDSDA